MIVTMGQMNSPLQRYYGSKNVTVNGNNATVHISSDTLFIDMEINPNTDYTVSVPQEYVYTNINNVKEYAPAVSFKFSSYIKEYNNKIDETPINVANAGVKKLYQFLLDNYDKASVSTSVAEFEKIHDIWDNKMLALGENGNIAKISEIFVAGGKYSYFMPWYTYGISDLDKSDHAKLSWWQDAASSKDVLFLEDID